MNSINDVIQKLDEIIAWAEQNKSTTGYFAALYRRMTIAVKKGIEQNLFENGPRMEQLDIVFAKRYFEAFELYKSQKTTTKAWQAAFTVTNQSSVTVLQHLLLGINAHINLDLGIAAAHISNKNEINNLEKDFNQINTIISGLIDDTKIRLSKIWLPFRIFTNLLDTESDGIINFSIKVARTFSWQNAKQLTMSEISQQANHIKKMDETVELLAQKLKNPGKFMKTILWIISLGETGTVTEKIKYLK
jgi:Family of unknown function (DUF5995)